MQRFNDRQTETLVARHVDCQRRIGYQQVACPVLDEACKDDVPPLGRRRKTQALDEGGNALAPAPPADENESRAQ